MAKNNEPATMPSASDGEIHEPALGVYVLTEFVYCPRAGLCAHETEHDEEEDAPRLSFFSFNPLYSVAEIEAALQRTMSELTWYAAGAAFSAVLAVYFPFGSINSLGSLGCSACSGFWRLPGSAASTLFN